MDRATILSRLEGLEVVIRNCDDLDPRVALGQRFGLTASEVEALVDWVGSEGMKLLAEGIERRKGDSLPSWRPPPMPF